MINPVRDLKEHVYWTNDIPKGLYRVTVIPFKVENGAKIRCWAGLICRSEVWICSGEEWDGHAGVGARQDVIRIKMSLESSPPSASARRASEVTY